MGQLRAIIGLDILILEIGNLKECFWRSAVLEIPVLRICRILGITFSPISDWADSSFRLNKTQRSTNLKDKIFSNSEDFISEIDELSRNVWCVIIKVIIYHFQSKI